MSRPPAPGTSSPGPPRGGVGHVKGGGQIQQHHGHSSNALAAGAGAADVPPLVKELKELLSQPVRLVLVDGKQHTGLLWAIDTGIGVAVLEIPKASIPAVKTSLDDYPTTAAAYPTSSLSSVKVAAQGGDASGSRTNFQIVKLQRMARVEKLQGPQAAALEKAKMTEITRDVNVAAAEARERAATTEALKRATKIGVGVSSLAQEVFDALSKTLPCRWADRHIIVMDEIVISPDNYDTASVPQYSLATLQALSSGKQVPGVPEDGKSKATRWERVSKVLEGERKKITAKAAAAAGTATTA